MVQTFFGRLLHGLRVRKIRPCSIFLARGIQKLVVGLLNPVNHVAVCVIKREVRCEGLGFCSVDSAGPRAKIKDRVIQIQNDLKVADGLTEETVDEVNLFSNPNAISNASVLGPKSGALKERMQPVVCGGRPARRNSKCVSVVPLSSGSYRGSLADGALPVSWPSSASQ